MPEQDQKTTFVVTDLDRDERLHISGPVVVALLWKSGRKARLRIDSSRDVRIQKTREASPSMAD